MPDGVLGHIAMDALTFLRGVAQAIGHDFVVIVTAEQIETVIIVVPGDGQVVLFLMVGNIVLVILDDIAVTAPVGVFQHPCAVQIVREHGDTSKYCCRGDPRSPGQFGRIGEK